MRKILALTICTIFLSFPFTVQADDNVTNQLEEILVQLENLDIVLDFLVANEDYLQYFVDGGFWVEEQKPLLLDLKAATTALRDSLRDEIAPDVATIKDAIASIQSDVAALSVDLAGYVSQVVNSVNGVTAELNDFRQWLMQCVDLDRISHLLTHSQLNESLNNLLSSLLYNLENLEYLENYSSTLAQILQAIQSLDYEDRVTAALNNIVTVLDKMGNIIVNIDLVEELENMDLHFDLDLGTALSRLEGDLSSLLDSTEHISYLFQNFITFFTHLKNDQELTNEQFRYYLSWYQGTFFNGLQAWATSHREWLFRQEAIENAEALYRQKRDIFFADDAQFPTGSEAEYQVEQVLDAVEMEEPELPDEKIYLAQDQVETQLDEVENELTEGMDLVDTEFKGFLQNINFRWGQFNPVLSFSFKPPLDRNNYTMQLTYDFSKSRLLPPCKAASTGIWGIVLFVSSFLAITETFNELVEN